MRPGSGIAVLSIALLATFGCSNEDASTATAPTLPGGAPITTRIVRDLDVVVAARALTTDDRGLRRTSADQGAPCHVDTIAARLPLSLVQPNSEITVVDDVGKVLARAYLLGGAVAEDDDDGWVCAWPATFSPGPPDGSYDVQIDGLTVGRLDTAEQLVVDATGDALESLAAASTTTVG